ncbi:hypothetical protein LZ31DRAFT_566602 [Colletotrichum somersetense]|nr:hypothetical protein LZ31DRAFT_566602 [Colletotrichum somersetense]
MSLYRFRSPFPLWTLPACSFILFPLGSVAKPTGGALAPVTLHSEIAYSTARACAANCLVHNGIWQCGSINGCYCNTALGSSATSYISSCISKGCSKVDDWSVDLTSMLNLYDSYYATANVAVVEAQATTTIAGSASSPTVASAARSSDIGQPTLTSGSVISGTASAHAQQTAAAEGDTGLSKSDIVALAASLGVGIPSLLIAALTLYFQIRKKRRDAAVSQSPAEMVPQRNAYGVNTYGTTPSYLPGSSGSEAW